MRIKWNKAALNQLGDHLEYIAMSSPLQSEKVQARIFGITDSLCLTPARYPPDKWKLNNDGAFRAFEEDHLRVSYRIFRASIHIIRVRHTSRKPLNY